MSAARKRELAIYDGQICLGIIKVSEDGKSTAYDPHGKRIGKFPSCKAATAALTSDNKKALQS
jgi:hypothetical protein